MDDFTAAHVYYIMHASIKERILFSLPKLNPIGYGYENCLDHHCRRDVFGDGKNVMTYDKLQKV